MVSAREVAQVAVFGGPLEKKGRTGWKKKYFYLTATQWIYFDSIDAPTPNFSISATEISAVEEILPVTDTRASQNTASSTHKGFVFHVTVGKKKSELRAATEDERDGWIGALMPYIGESAPMPDNHTHHPKSRSRAELAKIADYLKQQLAMQKKKASFTPEDVIQVLGKKFPHLSSNELLDWGETLMEAKLILGSSFDSGAELHFPEKTKKKLNATERNRLSSLMSSADFDPKGYAESFLKRNAPEKIDEHCETLLDQKDSIIHELKNDICTNYQTFLAASSEIRTMENSVSLMKAALVECKRALYLLQTTELPDPPELSLTLTSSQTMSNNQEDETIDDLEHNLETYLFEQDYEKFTDLVLTAKKTHSKNPHAVSVIDEAVQRFVARVNEIDNTSYQLNRENFVLYLIQLDQIASATHLCLRGYTSRMIAQVRSLVKPTGNVLQYVLTLCRTVFTTLLMCYEDFLVVFEGQPSTCFVSFTMWMTKQLKHFASEVALHIFEDSSSISREVGDFKISSKTISTSLRHLFYGARQLELAGLPIATYIAPNFQDSLLLHIRAYAKTIKWKVKDEVKRERWELVAMKIRDDEMREKEVVLSKSARVFSGYVQQYLRDITKLLQPSCATSHLPEILLATLVESELILVQYLQDIKSVYENTKTVASTKYAQVASMFITMQYVEDDILPRVIEALQGCIPKLTFEKSQFGDKILSLGEEAVRASLPRLAKALACNSVRWPELNLSSDNLPKDTDTASLFLSNLRNDLSAVSPDQLEQLTRSSEEAGDVATKLIHLLLTEMMEDKQAMALKEKSLGYGGTSQFIAELRMLSKDKSAQTLEHSLRQAYAALGKKGGQLAPDAWFSQYEVSMSKK